MRVEDTAYGSLPGPVKPVLNKGVPTKAGGNRHPLIIRMASHPGAGWPVEDCFGKFAILAGGGNILRSSPLADLGKLNDVDHGDLPTGAAFEAIDD